jgi:hypothetical protein
MPTDERCGSRCGGHRQSWKPTCPRRPGVCSKELCTRERSWRRHYQIVRDVLHAKQEPNLIRTGFHGWILFACQTHHAAHIHGRVALLVANAILAERMSPWTTRRYMRQAMTHNVQPLMWLQSTVRVVQPCLRVRPSHATLKLGEQMGVGGLQKPCELRWHIHQCHARCPSSSANGFRDVSSVRVHEQHHMIALQKGA